MTQKLSPHKVSKMMALYLDGYSQTDIANKLKIDQSTVSLYVSKFKSISEQQGVKAAGEEFGIMDHVEALHSLAVELTKAKLTVEEAKVGLKMELLLQKLGIKQEDYKDLIQACTKMKSEGFINSAVKLNKLEHTTGMTHEEIMAKAASTYQQLEQTQEDLLTAAGKLKTTKEELANIEKQKKLASQELETHMKNVGVNMKRLKMVENLALALKKAGEEDKQVENYIQRQQLLNKAGIAIDVFAQILEKAKVLTAKDDGKELLAMLDQYGSLAEIINSLENKAQSLTKEADDLEHKAELKGELEADIIKLRVEKTNLETCVAQSHEQKHILEDIKNEVNLLTKKKASLEHENANLEARNQQLIEDIQCKEEKVKDLDDLERKYNAAAAALTEAEARLEQEKHWLEILESFLGLVQSASSSLADLEKFATLLPGLIDQAKQGKYSPNLLKAHVLEELTGGALQVLKCHSCGAKFSVDKPAAAFGYHCPCCGSSSQVLTDKEGLAILKEALTKVKPQVIVVQPIAKQPKPNPPHGDKSGG